MWVAIAVALFVVFVLILVMRSKGVGTSGGVPAISLGTLDCFALLRQGAPARGILVKVSSQRRTKGTSSSGLYELRSVMIYVEVPGQKPYQVDCWIQVPARLCRFVLPGATLELRVNPGDSTNIAVFGPGAGLPAYDAPSAT